VPPREIGLESTDFIEFLADDAHNLACSRSIASRCSVRANFSTQSGAVARPASR
jgi:hypothetical protein